MGGAAMGVLRVMHALLLVLVLMAGQLMFLSERAYAGPCMCGQPCPQRSCYCDCHCLYTCAVDDYSQSFNPHSTSFQIPSVRSRLFTHDSADNDLTRTATLLGKTQGFLTLQCQTLKQMLNWASDLYMK